MPLHVPRLKTHLNISKQLEQKRERKEGLNNIREHQTTSTIILPLAEYNAGAGQRNLLGEGTP